MTWHVEDEKASHFDNEVNDNFCEWAEKKHGSAELGHVPETRGKAHDCLGMILHFSKKHHASVVMIYY